MTNIYKYRLWCNTHSVWEYIWSEDTPVSGADHTYDMSKTAIIETREPNKVTIEEEKIATGGYYQAEGFTIDVTGGINVVSKAYWFDNIANNILSIEYQTGSSHSGDIISAYAGKDETYPGSGIAGVLTANAGVPSAHSDQDYVVGDMVTYVCENPIFGSPVFTCIQNTTTHQTPISSGYWQRGFMLDISSSAIPYCPRGYEISVSDGVTIDHLGEIIFTDTVNNKIYVENAPSNQYNAGAYVRPYRCIVKNIQFGPPQSVVIGRDKIGGAYVAENTVVTVEYTNKSIMAKTLPFIISRLR